MVDEHPAHHPRCDAKEVSPVVELAATLIDQPHVRLVHEGRGLQGVSRGFATEEAARQPS